MKAGRLLADSSFFFLFSNKYVFFCFFVAFTHVRLLPDQLLLTCIECLGEVYLDGAGELVINRDGVPRLYAVLYSPFGGVNSPSSFLDLSLPIARCCVLLKALSARIYVDDGYGSGSRTLSCRSLVSELTAEQALELWQSLCRYLYVMVAPHKVERKLDLGLLGLFVEVSRICVRRGDKNASNIAGACQVLFASMQGDRPYKTVTTLFAPVETVVHANRYVCELCVGTKAFLADVSRQLHANRKRKYVNSRSLSYASLRADLRAGAVEDLHWLWLIAPTLDTMPIYPAPPAHRHHFLDVGADASYEPEARCGGYGCQCYEVGLYGSFTPAFLADLSSHCPKGRNSAEDSARQLIAYLELWTVLRLLQLFGARLKDSTVHLREDNQGVYYWLCSLNAPCCAASAGIMKSIVMQCYLHRIVLAPEWRSSERNVIPDALSGVLNDGRNRVGGAADGDKLSISRALLDMWAESRAGKCTVQLVRDSSVLDPGISVVSRMGLYDQLDWQPPPSLKEVCTGGLDTKRTF